MVICVRGAHVTQYVGIIGCCPQLSPGYVFADPVRLGDPLGREALIVGGALSGGIQFPGTVGVGGTVGAGIFMDSATNIGIAFYIGPGPYVGGSYSASLEMAYYPGKTGLNEVRGYSHSVGFSGGQAFSFGGELLLNATGQPYGVAGSLGYGSGADAHWFTTRAYIASLNVKNTAVANTLDLLGRRNAAFGESGGVPDIQPCGG